MEHHKHTHTHTHSTINIHSHTKRLRKQQFLLKVSGLGVSKHNSKRNYLNLLLLSLYSSQPRGPGIFHSVPGKWGPASVAAGCWLLWSASLFPDFSFFSRPPRWPTTSTPKPPGSIMWQKLARSSGTTLSYRNLSDALSGTRAPFSHVVRYMKTQLKI